MKLGNRRNRGQKWEASNNCLSNKRCVSRDENGTSSNDGIVLSDDNNKCAHYKCAC